MCGFHATEGRSTGRTPLGASPQMSAQLHICRTVRFGENFIPTELRVSLQRQLIPPTELFRISYCLAALERVSQEKWLMTFLPGLTRMLSNCETRRIVPARDRPGSVHIKHHCSSASLGGGGAWRVLILCRVCADAPCQVGDPPDVGAR